MSEIGDVFAGDTSVSASKLDAKAWLVCTGSKISYIPTNQAVAAAIPTSTGGGFTIDVPVYRKTDGSGWKPFFHKHLHGSLSDTDDDGGTYYNIIKGNSQMILAELLGDDYYSGFYKEVSTGTVTTNTQTGYSNIAISSSTTTNAYASIFVSTVKINFAYPSVLVCKMNQTGSADYLTRFGVGMEKIQNSTDNTAKFGAEGCPANGTNFQLVAGDGAGRSQVDGLTAVATSVKCLKFIYTPGASVVLQAAYGGTTATITSNCPSTGTLGNENQLLRFGTKNTAASAKVINLYGAKLYGLAANTDWF